MIGKTTRLLMVVIVGILALGTMATAGTIPVIDVMRDALNQIDATTVHPVVLEDDDWSVVVDAQGEGETGTLLTGGTGTNVQGLIDCVGDKIQGVMQITGVFTGSPVDTLDVFKDDGSQNVTKDSGVGTVGGSTNAVKELVAAFELEAVAAVTKFPGGPPPPAGTGQPWISFKAGDLATLTGDSSISADAAFALYEDDKNNFTAGSTGTLAGELVTVIDGTLWSTVGFTPLDSTDDDFYLVNASATGFAFSLDFLTGAPAIAGYAGPLENEFGTTVAGTGQLFTYTGTGDWVKTSDADFKVLYAPVPAAVYPGLFLLMGLGALRRRMRRKAEM